jgi:hypothetical protein
VSEESVVAAVRRLNRAHPQLNRRKLIAPVGALLQAHMIDGAPARDTIVELESLYRRLADGA